MTSQPWQEIPRAFARAEAWRRRPRQSLAPREELAGEGELGPSGAQAPLRASGGDHAPRSGTSVPTVRATPGASSDWTPSGGRVTYLFSPGLPIIRA
jgi:hypothetical protein